MATRRVGYLLLLGQVAAPVTSESPADQLCRTNLKLTRSHALTRCAPRQSRTDRNLSSAHKPSAAIEPIRSVLVRSLHVIVAADLALGCRRTKPPPDHEWESTYVAMTAWLLPACVADEDHDTLTKEAV